MMDIHPIWMPVLLIGCHLTLLLLALVVIWEFGRVVKRQVLATRGRFRLRTLLLVAAVVQGAVALAAWQMQGRAFSIIDFVVLFAIDFLFLGLAFWVLCYCVDDILQLSGRRRRAHGQHEASVDVDVSPKPDAGKPVRRKRWWAKQWPIRYRPMMRPGQIYRIPTGRDKF